MRHALMIISCFVFSSVNAQDTRRFVTEEKWSASLTGAIIPLPEFNAGIQPGIWYRFSERISFSTEVTLRLGKDTDHDSSGINRKYFRIQPELRYMFPAKKSKWESYLGLRLSWATRKFERMDGFYALNDQREIGFYYDRAKLNSPVTTASLQGGTIIPFGSDIALDLFMGFGARFIKTTYSDIVNPVSGTRPPRSVTGPYFFSSYSIEGNLTWFHLNTGFRLIYHFGQ